MAVGAGGIASHGIRVAHPQNRSLAALSDAFTDTAGTTLSVPAPGILSSDLHSLGGQLRVVSSSSPTHGKLTLKSDGAFQYTPASGFVGTDSFTYRVIDGKRLSNKAAVTITVTPPKRPPVARNDAFTATAGTTLSVAAPGVLGNDSDPNGNPLSTTLDAAPAHGTLVLNADGSYRYTPTPGFVGTDSFTYKASDATGATSTSATVTITVALPPKQPPVAHNDAFTDIAGTTLSVPASGILGNDSDPSGEPLSAALVSTPAHGTLVLNANGSFTYSPASRFVGADSFTYTAFDPSGAASAPATVTLTVTSDARQVLESAAKAEAAAYIRTQEASDAAAMASGMMMADMQAVLNLVPFESATSIAILGGAWNDPNTWLGQTIPGPGANVWIMPGRTVTIDSVLTDSIATVRVSGTLQFDPSQNTQLEADTVVIDPAGTLLMGTQNQPIEPGVVAQMLFTGNGPINTTWDPTLISRGLISLGTAEIYGSFTTPWLALAQPPMAGNNSLQLSAVPVGWNPGDTLVLAGTQYTGTSQTQDEQLQIASIQGTTVYLTSALQYNHAVPTQAALAAQFGAAPPGAPLTVDVADLTRNVRFTSQNPNVLEDRGHVMFMNTQQEAVVNAGFYGLGRTDKSVPISSTNPRGRYALHFHEDGTGGTPILVSGVAVDGSPGWGIDNHSSNVDVIDSVVYGAVGAAFVTEAGDEKGAFFDDFAIDMVGAANDDPDDYRARQDINDYGFTGDGFWLESPTVAMIGNVVAGAASYAIIYYPKDFEGLGLSIPVIPIAECSDNTIYASRRGLRLYSSNPTGGVNMITGLTVWNVLYDAFGADYSSSMTLSACRFIGNTYAGAVYIDSAANVSYQDCYVVGYGLGFVAGYGGSNEIADDYLNNVVNLQISKNVNITDALLGLRQVVIQGVTFAGGGIAMESNADVMTTQDPPFWIWYAPEQITWNGRQLYYPQQAADFVLDAPVSGLAGLTNAETSAQFGLAYAGAVLPAGATTVAGLTGGLVGPSQTVGAGPVFPNATYYDKPNGQFDEVMYDPVTQTCLVVTLAPQ